MSCINKSHPDFIKLQEEVNINPLILAAKIGIWMEENSTDEYPTAKDLGLETSQLNVDRDTQNGGNTVLGNTRSWQSSPNTGDVVSNKVLETYDENKLDLSEEDLQKFNEVAAVVGREEALRDVLEQRGEVRSPEVVFQKLTTRDYDNLETIEEDYYAEAKPFEMSRAVSKVKDLVKITNNQKAMLILSKLSNQLGVDFEIISEEEFDKQYPNRKNATGYFKNGKVFLIQERFDANTVVHEFGHPIIKSIFNSNRDLFNELYDKLKASPEFSEIEKHLDTMYASEFEKESDEYKEEALVYALQYAHANQADLQKDGFFKELFFQIKQFLRKLFGKKINISKLNPNTTIADIADMINDGEEFLLDRDFIDMDDVAMFGKMYEEDVKIMAAVSVEQTRLVINEFYEVLKKQVGNLTKENDVFRWLADDISDEYNQGIIQQLRKDVEELTTFNTRKPVKSLEKIKEEADVTQDMEQFHNKLKQFISVIVNTGILFDKLSEKFATMDNVTLDTKQDIETLYSLWLYANNWNDYFKKLDDAETGYFNYYIKRDNPVYAKFSAVKNKINDLQANINRKVSELSLDAFYDHLVEVHKPIEKLHLDKLQQLQDKGLWAEYENAYSDYYGVTLAEEHEYNLLDARVKNKEALTYDEQRRHVVLRLNIAKGERITKDKVKLTSANFLGDAYKLGNALYGFITSDDIVTSGFAKYINKHFNTIAGNVNAKESKMLDGLNDVLKGTSFSGNLFGEAGLGKAISHVDTYAVQNDKGELEVKEEYAFMSNFRNHRVKIKELDIAIDRARSAYVAIPNDDNYDLWLDTIDVKAQFEADYMHRDNTSAYYEHDHLMRTPMGRKARRLADDIYTELNALNRDYSENITDGDYQTESARLWFDLKQLKNKFDRTGKLKTGDDLAIAELLTNYDKLTKDFHDYEEVPGKFENAFAAFEAQILTKYSKGSLEYEYEMNTWLSQNTQVEVNSGYYELRKAKLDRRKELLEKLDQKNAQIAGLKGIIDSTILFEEVSNIVKPTVNESGVYEGTRLSLEEQQKITDLNKQIQDGKKLFITKSGLSKHQYLDYVRLSNRKNLKPHEKLRLEAFKLILRTKLQGLEVNDDDLLEVDQIDNDLREMSYSRSTEDYKNMWFDFMYKNSDVYDAVYNAVKKTYKHSDLYNNPVLSEDMVDLLLSDLDLIDELKDLSPEFKMWFEANHFSDEKVVYALDPAIGYQVPKGVVSIWTKSTVWNFSGPYDIDKYYNTKIMNHDLFPNGTLEVNGEPRVPNKAYKSKIVKSDYVTSEIERDKLENGQLILANKDSQGQWLPKTVAEGAIGSNFINDEYQEMLRSKPKLFDALMYLKNIYLDNQVGLDSSQINGLAFPKERINGTIEKYTTKGFIERKRLNIKRAWSKSNADDFDSDQYRKSSVGYDSNALANTMTRPISGNYDMDLAEQSRNIVSIMGRWLYSVETYKVARDINPVAQMLQATIKNLGADPELKQLMDSFKTLNMTKPKLSPAESKRLKNITNMIEKHIDGVQVVMPGILDNRFGTYMLRIQQWSSKVLSKRFFSYNVYSGVKNYVSGEIMLAATSAEHRVLNPNDLRVTKRIAAAASNKIVSESWSKKQKDPIVQLITVMDAIPDFAKKRAGHQGSETFMQSVFKGNQRYAIRKYLGDMVPLHQFFAILNHNKFELNGKETVLFKAIQLDAQGRVVTMPNVPAEYSISYSDDNKIILGSKLNQLMDLHQNTLTKTIGASNDLNAPDIYRTLAGRMGLFLIKFFPNLLRDRMKVGKVRVQNKQILGKNVPVGLRFTPKSNVASGTRELGSYVAILESIGELIRTKGKHLSYENYTGLLKIAIGVSIEIALYLAQKSMRFKLNNDDDDDSKAFLFDEEREGMFQWMSALTSVPQAPQFIRDITGEGVAPQYTDERGRQFDATNFFKLQVLRTIVGVRKETGAFYPTPLLRQSINMSMFKGVFSSTNPLSDILKDFEYAWEGELYKKDAGPYSWQQSGRSKVLNLFLKYEGFDGKMIDPAYGLKQEFREFD